MVLAAPVSARLIAARGSRFTLVTGDLFCLLAFIVMLVLWKEGSSYWEVALAFAFIGIGVGLGRHPGSHARLPVRCRCGAWAWRRAPPTCSETSAARSCSRSSGHC